MSVTYLADKRAGMVNATAAKVKIETMPGVRSVALQTARGRTYLVISAQFNTHRETREVPVETNGAISRVQLRHALAMLFGRPVAEAFAV